MRDAPPINPGIRRTVALLQSWGFTTVDSGDGVTNVEAGMECAREYANVAMVVEPADLVHKAQHLAELLSRACNIALVPVGQGPSMQASFDPATGIAILDLMEVDDSMLPAGVEGR